MFRPLLRQLAEGEAVTLDHLAEAAGSSVDQVRQAPAAEYDADGPSSEPAGGPCAAGAPWTPSRARSSWPACPRQADDRHHRHPIPRTRTGDRRLT
ncbi:hypothetical protein [Amycolatopsis thermophila]|uniref:hypothetical protein n=1 Tax=Amycolatopsis thermophila TaxID=206084 RepID=UPI00351F9754